MLDVIGEINMTHSDKWDKRDRWRSISISLYSKGGIALLLFAYMGVMYVINLVSHVVGNWLR